MNEVTFFDGQWKEESILGEGSYGRVYKAKKVDYYGEVSYSAIKQIKLPQTSHEINSLKTEGMSIPEIEKYYNKYLKQWTDEIKFMERFKDDVHIVRIEDYEIIPNENGIGGTINIRMELLNNLDDYVLNNDITDKEIIKMAIDVSSALIDCEEHNVVHRDIKPDNIFVNSKGIYKIGDFGVAKQIESTASNMSRRGTENYMAPELYKNLKGNKTVDIYSLGIMLYKYFNYNRLPFLPNYPNEITASDRENAVIKRVQGFEMPLPKNATGDIAHVILKACNFDVQNRYQSAKDLKRELEKIYSSIENPKKLFDFKNNQTENEEYDSTAPIIENQSGTVGIFDNKEDFIFEEKKNQRNKTSLKEKSIKEKSIKKEEDEFPAWHIYDRPKEEKEKFKFTPKNIVKISVVILLICLIVFGIITYIFSRIYIDVRDKSAYNVYGKYINYKTDEIDENIKWQIIYANENNVYIIPDRNVENLSFKEIVKQNTSNIDNKNVQRYFSYITKFNNSSNSLNSVKYLLDTNNWNKYLNDKYANYAIGATPIEMFVKSYNNVHDTKLEYVIENNGYRIKYENEVSYNSQIKLTDLVYNITEKTQYEDLYNYYNDNSANKIAKAWIAGISADNTDMIYSLSDTLNNNENYTNEIGIRPVVELKSDVMFKENKDGTYEIVSNLWTKVLNKLRNVKNIFTKKEDEENHFSDYELVEGNKELSRGLSYQVPSTFSYEENKGYVYDGQYNLSFYITEAYKNYDKIDDFIKDIYGTSTDEYECKSFKVEKVEINGRSWQKAESEKIGINSLYGSHIKGFYYILDANNRWYCVQFVSPYINDEAKWIDEFEIIKNTLKI